MTASKEKGLWKGGGPPLGYNSPPDPKIRELALNPAEAATVRSLFELSDLLENLALVEREAAHLGLRSKRHKFRLGRELGGNPLSRGQINKILANPVDRGLIRHKDKCWPGRHPAIIDEALWNRVQTKFQRAAARPRGRRPGLGAISPDPAILKGKLRDETGDRLTPTHTIRRGRRLCDYISHRLLRGGPDATA